MIPRLVDKSLEEAGTRRVAAGLLGDTYTVREYTVEYRGILAQDPGMVELTPVPPSALLRLARQPWTEYCRWHSGPLDRPDDPLTRLYCNTPAEGYCRHHKRSDRALYELCLTLRGERGLNACRAIDKRVRTEYVVYMTDFGGAKPKVGVTRRFRALQRLAEQPHVSATILAVADSAYEARRMEMSLSRAGIAQEQSRRNGLPSRSLAESVARLSYWAERAARHLGLEWSGEIIRIAPPSTMQGAPVLRSLSQLPGPFRLEAYWGGLLLARDAAGHALLVPFRRLQHRDSLLLDQGDQSPSDNAEPVL